MQFFCWCTTLPDVLQTTSVSIAEVDAFCMQAVMYDPVIAADGHTYERAAMQEWLTSHAASPVTGEQLPHMKVVPNVLIRVILQQHVL